MAGGDTEAMCAILKHYEGYIATLCTRTTQWYLRLTAEAYPHIRQVCEAELGGMYADLLKFLPEEVEDADDKTD